MLAAQYSKYQHHKVFPIKGRPEWLRLEVATPIQSNLRLFSVPARPQSDNRAIDPTGVIRIDAEIVSLVVRGQAGPPWSYVFDIHFC